jgi:hypothetical protein
MAFSSCIVMPRHEAPRFGGARQGQNKNIENNPMQSKIEPGARPFCCTAARAEEEIQPDLIPL